MYYCYLLLTLELEEEEEEVWNVPNSRSIEWIVGALVWKKKIWIIIIITINLNIKECGGDWNWQGNVKREREIKAVGKRKQQSRE